MIDLPSDEKRALAEATENPDIPIDFWKAVPSNVATDAGMATVPDKSPHLEKAPAPMDAKVEGNERLWMADSAKALFPMVWTFPNETEFSESHLLKALFPMETKDDGNETDVSPELWNALASIAVNPF